MDHGVVSPALKRAAGFAGAALCVLAAVLLLRRGVQLGDVLVERLTKISVAAFGVALVFYCVGAAALGFAWVLLARAATASPVRARPLFVAHLRSQLAKYLPGNVFHFAYRHVAARREGLGHRALGGALAFESILLVAAAATLASGVASDPRLDAVTPWLRWVVHAAPLMAIALALAGSFAMRRLGSADARPSRTLSTFAAVFAIDAGFFLLAAGALRLLCEQPDLLPFAAWCGWLALAWIAGYVTPGAPGGLGLREAVLVLGLGPVLGEAEALAIAFAYRLVTIGADALLAGIGFGLRDRAETSA
jgi:uncharacterized membrane protein YbhN (UPF0104 family)